MNNRTINLNILIVLALLVMLMATLLTACSNQSAAAPAKEEATEVKEDTAEVEQVKEEVAEPEPTAEPTPEPTPKPTPEAVVYEGIDMESTLPGEEWIKTFNGIINEPKLVVFNDDTNKKVIVESGEKVEFSKTDTLSIYGPSEKLLMIEEWDMFNFSQIDLSKLVFNDINAEVGEEVVTEHVVEYDGKDYELTATLVVTE